MIQLLLATSLSSLLLAQGHGKAQPSPSPTPVPVPVMVSPTDEFGPDLKAWLDANKAGDKDAASKALGALQRRRAERNLTSVEDVAGVIGGRADAKAGEGARTEAADALKAAIVFAPDEAFYHVRKAEAEGNTGDAWAALDLVRANALQAGRMNAAYKLGLLVIGGLFAIGFSLAILIRYAAVFSHDVAEGLSGPLKSLSLFMAVLFLALPLAGFMGWGYLPFWWITLLFIFESRPEKAVSIALLIALALSTLALPQIIQQRSVDAATDARTLYLAASGGTSSEAEALVKQRVAADASDPDWSLLFANLARRGGRYDEALAFLNARATSDPRFAHNAAALELNRTAYGMALPGLTAAADSSMAPTDKATALYNLSLLQVNTLAFDKSKASRQKGDAIDAAKLARYDRLFTFNRDGSLLQAPPDIAPPAAKIMGASIPVLTYTAENLSSRLGLIAIALLLFIPMIMKFRGNQSFSKQCPKCGTTFCWLCQTRSTSQDVCSQCHHLFVVKKGIPPAARAAKNQEITRYVTVRGLRHRIASLIAPGAGHISVGHFLVGLPLLLVWAISAGVVITVHYLAPLVVSSGALGAALVNSFGAVAALTYIVAQLVKPKAPTVASAPRRSRTEAVA